jgi:recombination associated protein RdgC
MLKEISVFKFAGDIGATIDAKLAKAVFEPCGPTQEFAIGFVPPRGEKHSPLVERFGRDAIIEVAIETKKVPGEAVKRKLAEVCEAFERNEGRKPGRKEARDLRDEVVHQLLPHAFSKQRRVKVWIDYENGRIVIGSSSNAVLDEVTTLLVKTMDQLQLSRLNTQVAPQAAMTSWLVANADDWPEHFAPGRHVELHSGDEMKSVVKFDRHHLDDEEMRKHISQGKLPTKLALDWDGRVTFVLTEGTQIKKIAFLDGVFDDRQQDEGGFDADVAIATGELRALVTDLVAALGGELA